MRRDFPILLLVTCCLLLGQQVTLLGQSPNLLINGGFEIYSDLTPNTPFFCYSAGTLTEPYFPGWHNDELSPDAFNEICDFCGNMCVGAVPINVDAGGWNGLPIGSFNYQYPHSGKGYAGLYFASNHRITLNSPPYNNFRECMQGQFSEPLKKGQGYCIEFWVNNTDIHNHTVDQLGVYFHAADTAYKKGLQNVLTDYNFFELEPQVTINTGPLTDTMNWQLVTADYIAQGGEKYFILGNFQNDDEINWIKWQNNYDDSVWGKIAYLFFDDIAIYECDDIAIPDEEITPPNIITPNGDGVNDAFTVYGLKPKTKLVVYNRWGNEVFRTDNYNNDWRGETRTLGVPTQVTDGVYFYVLTLPGGMQKTGTLTVTGH